MSFTTILGLAFLVGQVLAYRELVALKEFFTGGNVSHSFIYVISGAHALHVVGGVIYLLMVCYNVFRNRVTSGNMTQLEMCATYWHFLGVLWVYLYVFLILNR
jgi:cytochrome c oxidase subunit 3